MTVLKKEHLQEHTVLLNEPTSKKGAGLPVTFARKSERPYMKRGQKGSGLPLTFDLLYQKSTADLIIPILTPIFIFVF